MAATAIVAGVDVAGEWPPSGRAVGGAAGRGSAAAGAASGDAERRAEARVSFALNGHLELALTEAVPTKAEIRRLWACLKELSRSLAPLGQPWRLSPFGSVKNQFLTRGSDIDVTMYRTDAQDEGDAAAAAMVLEDVARPMLTSNRRFEVLRFVGTGARIPILCLRFDGAVDVDLSCHNTEPLRNTQLLWAYARANPLVRGLVLLVKRWAKAAGVSGAQDKHLTSYAITLMAVYFLQVHPAFRLPCLPTHEFGGLGPPPECAAKGRWECEASLPSRSCGSSRSTPESSGGARRSCRCASAGGARPATRSFTGCRTWEAPACMWRTPSSWAGT